MKLQNDGGSHRAGDLGGRNGPTSSGTNSSPAAISVQSVSKEYRGFSLFRRRERTAKAWALRDISFEIREGETLGLLGPNGAGKTTLLKILTNLIYPTTGQVLFHGHDLRTHSREVRRMSGLVTSDERSFYWRLTGRKNLEFFATLYGLSPGDARARIGLLLDKLGLTHAADRPFAGYSSGMKQKLAIARGLLPDPRIVFYDEPTRSLDPLSCLNIRRWISQTRQEHPDRTHLLATNQLDEAEQLCDRVIIIHQGRLVAGGSIDEVRRQFDARDYEIHRILFLGVRPPELATAEEERGLLEVETEPEEGGRTRLRIRTRKNSHAFSWVLDSILRGGGVVLECHTEAASFDEVFCTLVQASGLEEAASTPEAVGA